MKITDLSIGNKAKIIGFNQGAAAYRHKLISMGLIAGTEFNLTRIAPLGDPIQISVRGFSLVLRKKEAELLLIEIVTT